MIAALCGVGLCCDVVLCESAGIYIGEVMTHRDRGRKVQVMVRFQNGRAMQGQPAVAPANFLTVVIDGEVVCSEVEGLNWWHIEELGLDIDLMSVDSGVGLFENWAPGLSYMPVVRDLMAQSWRPRRVFEWGPGRSSIFFASQFGRAEIHGVEHHPAWFAKCETLMAKFPTVKISHQLISLSPAQNGHYVTAPLWLGGKFDLMFIDGRMRPDCVEVARHCVSPDGVVLLHDAHRPSYQDAIARWPHSEIIHNTAVLRL